MSKICGVYKITNPAGEVYIGSSSDIKSRWSYHKHNTKNKTKMSLSILSFGPENHIFDILEVCDISSARIIEKYFIKKSIDDGVKLLNTYILLRPKKYYYNNPIKEENRKHYRSGGKYNMKRRKGPVVVIFNPNNGIYYTSYKEVSECLNISLAVVHNYFLGKQKLKLELIRV